VMAKAQGFILPEDYQPIVEDWVRENISSEKWGNARSIRSVIEKMREAQAVRLSRDPTSLELDLLTTSDLQSALKGMESQLR
jgi:stage V sporulation protein K